jgi:TIR domain-containing protein
MSNDSGNLLIRAFFSHSYDAAEINRYFYELLAIGDRGLQFEVDEGRSEGEKIPTNVTRIERKIRDADAFVGVYPLPPAADDEPGIDYLQKKSRYFRFELDIARRAGIPAIVFYDKRYRGVIEPPPTIAEKTFDSREVPHSVSRRTRKRFEKLTDEFFEQVSGWIVHKREATEENSVGMILSSQDYDDQARQELSTMLKQARWKPTDLAWPPQLKDEGYLQLACFDWVLADCGQAAAESGISTYLHARMIPTMRVRRTPKVGPERAGPGSSDYTLFGDLTVGYGDPKKEARWSEPGELRGAVGALLATLSKEGELIADAEMAEEYFRRAAATDIEVFLSCAGEDVDFANQLAEALKKRFRSAFYYKEPRDLTPGKPWMPEITQKISEARLGVILHSRDWLKKDYCQDELDQMNRRRIENKMVLIPVKLRPDDPVLPDEIRGITYVKPWEFNDDAGRVADEIVEAYRRIELDT